MLVATNGLVAVPSSYRLLFLSFDKSTLIVIKGKSGLFPERGRCVVLPILGAFRFFARDWLTRKILASDWLSGPPQHPYCPTT